jgi:hypothetical protein
MPLRGRQRTRRYNSRGADVTRLSTRSATVGRQRDRIVRVIEEMSGEASGTGSPRL